VYLHFQAARQREYFLSYVFLAICLISPAVAKSRGGVLFGIFAITIIFLSAILNQRLSKRSSSRRLINIACLVMAITCAVNVLIMSDPVRASGVFKRVQLGFIVAANSSDYFCDRNSRSSSAALSANQISSELSDANALNLTEGDGSRVIAAITGARLVAEHPMGINQSRQAFQTALIIHCGFAPKNMLSHSHSGWINLALAIGLPGAIIFLALQIATLKYGIQNRVINNAINPFAFALIFWTLVWTVRAMFDASLQDHVMEIQAFILALLLGLVINFTKCSDLKK
jgi:O-antigen ligase